MPNADPFPSTYKPFPRRTTLIRHVTIMTAAGPAIPDGSVLLRDGKIVAVGAAQPDLNVQATSQEFRRNFAGILQERGST